MATIYIQLGSGTGAGTLLNPYFYDELGTAETQAGNGGTILFTDGTYTLSGSQTWDGGGFSSMTYKSQNLGGAYLLGATSARRITVATGTNVATVDGFKTANVYFFSGGIFHLNNLSHEDTLTGLSRGSYGFAFGNNNVCTIKNSSVYLIYDHGSNNRLFNQMDNAIVEGCSFYMSTTATVPSGGVTQYGGSPTTENTIFMCDTEARASTTLVDPTICTNCCMFQVNETSGGTNNVFADPQFVDAVTGDLRLRPSSPCINAGTA
mgnify:CR=1 FL=1